MSQNKVYGEIMYGALKSIMKSNTFYHSEDYQNDNIINALVKNGSYNVIEQLLPLKDLSRLIFSQILEAFFEIGDYKKVIEILKTYPEKSHNFDLERFIKPIIDNKLSQELIIEFFGYIEGKEENSFYRFIRQLLEGGAIEIAEKIINTHKEGGEKKLLLIVKNILQGQTPNVEEILGAIQETLNIKIDNNDEKQSFENKISKTIEYIIEQLHNKNTDKEILIKIITTCKQQNSQENEISSKISIDTKISLGIISQQIENGEFSQIDEFIKICGNLKWYMDEINQMKLDYAIKTKNKQLHKEILQYFVKKYEKSVENKTGKERRDRLENCHYNALKYMELAIFKIIHGEEEKATEYIDLMIKHTESITDTITKETPQRYKTFIKEKNKDPLKRKIKTKFIELGIFEWLPAKFGWNTMIKIKDKEYFKLKEEKKEERRRQRIEEHNSENEKYQKQEDEKQQAITDKLIDLLNKGDEKESISFFSESMAKEHRRQPTNYDWQRGIMILEKFPTQFTTILNKFFKSKDIYDYEHWHRSYKQLTNFFIRGIQLGAIGKQQEDKFIERLYFLGRTRNHTVDIELVLPIIDVLLSIGEIKRAREFFSKFNKTDSYGQGGLKDKDISICLAHIINSTIQTEVNNGIFSAYKYDKAQIQNILPLEEQVKFYDTKMDLSQIFKNDNLYNESFQELKKLITNGENIFILISARCKKITQNCLRDYMTIRQEFQFLQDQNIGISDKIRRRILYTLIELKVPGMEASVEIKKKETPIKIQNFLFKKLIQKGYITKNLLHFLGNKRKDHINYLRKLLAQHQNEFNTVIDTIVNYCNHSNMFYKNINNSYINFDEDEDEDEEIDYPSYEKAYKQILFSQWEEVFKVLQIIGTITPGIWSQAIKDKFDTEKLKQLKEKITSEKKKLFLNIPLSEDISDGLLAEIVYQAFKPVNMSYHNVESILKKIPDCCTHIQGYNFPTQGYELNITQKHNVTFRKGKEKNIEIVSFIKTLENRKKVLDKEQTQHTARALCEIGRLKTDDFEKNGLDLISTLFLGDEFLFTIFDFENLDFGEGRENIRYQQIQILKDFFEVYLPDNLEEKITKFFKQSSAHTSQMLKSFINTLKDEKKRKNLTLQLKIQIPQEINEKVAIHIISQVILQKSLTLKKFKKTLKQEIKNYVNIDGSELVTNGVKLKAYVSKNKASFFAKASAGLCTMTDIESFKRTDHFHINLIEEHKQECVGNLMLYNMEELTGKRILLLRGFNPNTGLLKHIDIPSYCESILEIAIKFASENKFKAVYLCGDILGNHTISNRIEIANYLLKKYGSNKVEIDFPIRQSHENSINTKAMHPIHIF